MFFKIFSLFICILVGEWVRLFCLSVRLSVRPSVTLFFTTKTNLTFHTFDQSKKFQAQCGFIFCTKFEKLGYFIQKQCFYPKTHKKQEIFYCNLRNAVKWKISSCDRYRFSLGIRKSQLFYPNTQYLTQTLKNTKKQEKNLWKVS